MLVYLTFALTPILLVSLAVWWWLRKIRGVITPKVVIPPNSTTSTTPTATGATDGDKPKHDLGKKVASLVALVVAGAFVYFYNWAETPPGKLVMPMFQEMSKDNQELVSWSINVLLLATAVYLGWKILTGDKGGSLGIGSLLPKLGTILGWTFAMSFVALVASYSWHYFSPPSGPPAVVRMNFKATADESDWKKFERIGPLTVLEVTIPTVSVRDHPCKIFRVSLKVTEPVKTTEPIKLKNIGGFPLHKFVVDDDGRRYMTEHGLQVLGVTGTLALVSKTNCS